MRPTIVALLAVAAATSAIAQDSTDPADLFPAVTIPASPPADVAPAQTETEPAAAPAETPASVAAQPRQVAQARPAAVAEARPVVIDRLDLGTTSITGNQELPKVLYIVPWKRSDLGDLIGRPVNSLLDEVLAPVDRSVFERHLSYYETLHGESQEE
jgi:hypothetical protein